MKYTKNHPELQEFHIEGVKHIAPADAFELINTRDAVLIDVREPDEIENEQIPLDTILYYPMSTIVDKLNYISKEQSIILICPGGIRSTKVANLLNLHAYPNVANLDGGFMSWKKQNLPFETKLINTGGCGCGCNSTSADNSGNSCC
ncbi:MAG: rhodanese-like domain-containing protein [Thiohalospira sp.]